MGRAQMGRTDGRTDKAATIIISLEIFRGA